MNKTQNKSKVGEITEDWENQAHKLSETYELSIQKPMNKTQNKTSKVGEKIMELTELWYRLVSLDHHKDRDCHWYINTVYSYGQPPKFRIEHYGYIWKDVNEEFDSYDEAENGIIESITEAIKAEKKWAQEVKNNHLEYLNQGAPKNWDDDQIERAEKIISLIP